MDIFQTHADIVGDYRDYIQSFIHIKDDRIRTAVLDELRNGRLWPEPLIQFNPAFEPAGLIGEIEKREGLHPGLRHAFHDFTLFRHQVEAVRLGMQGRGFVVTSGTGSGKSLTYIATIFNDLLSRPAPAGIQAIVVYPMNALINSQADALRGFAETFEKHAGAPMPFGFAQYTGQEKEDARTRVKASPPQILLTNFMMLELILTRIGEQPIRDAIFENLRFLVFDELHTYRGRQGGDVAMLIRRIRSQCHHPVVCMGTSATMVSGGSQAEQRKVIAETATTFFGTDFLPEQVVMETLAPSLAVNGMPTRSELQTALKEPLPSPLGPEALARHPVLVWIEQAVALLRRGEDLVRGEPLRLTQICERLAAASGVDPKACESYLMALLQALSVANADATADGRRGDVLLPFKLHQFFAQTGAVCVTLGRPEVRPVTLDPNKLHDEKDGTVKPFYPVVFSRGSGHEFICVTLTARGMLERREFLDIETRDDEDDDQELPSADGYLILGDDVWSEDDLESLPDAWIRQRRDGRYEPRPDKAPRFPRRIWFDEEGHWSDSPQSGWQAAWFMPAPLLFDPTSGVAYEHRTREGTKLTSLGKEGRSTSTTITCFSILDRLARHGCPENFQKLLSFTDNRQDAALQAGHFNDFIQVVQLRAAIRRAVESAPLEGLTIHSIGDAVFRALDMAFPDYANHGGGDPLPSVRASYEETFRRFLSYRILHDLRRSWRIILPNLEQCALLRVEYQFVDELGNAAWADFPEMARMNPGQRRFVITTVLEAFRLAFAIQSRNYLDDSVLREQEDQIRDRLRAPWTLDRDEHLPPPQFMALEGRARGGKRLVNLIGPASDLGKVILRFIRENFDADFDRAAYGRFMEKLLGVLQTNQLLEARPLAFRREAPVMLYQLKADVIRWRAGDRLTASVDLIKNRSFKGHQNTKPNEFFQRLYQYDFSRRKSLRGDEHTGQLQTDVRLQREAEFKEGRISALFCSPTMELGIDIKLLSIVHMRNVPPNPANYAQRAGRAGRSGQAALVFNFCSSYAPHDRHYFQNQVALVAGNVTPPRLDLCNEELLRAHLHAMVLAEVGLSNIDDSRNSSLFGLVDSTDEARLSLRPEIADRLRLDEKQVARLRSRFLRVIEGFRKELDRQSGHWFSESWIDAQLGSLATSLDTALERWRNLYRAARAQLTKATRDMDSGLLVPRSDEYRRVERELRLANHQLSQLRNDTRTSTGNQLSEFYPYRYLAAEAWLPGYNFTRLPLRVFVETQEGGGEFLSRPRSIALREFGPLNVIYHSGRKYKVSQLVSQSIEQSLRSVGISARSGYYLGEEQKTLEICPFSGARLSEAGNRREVTHLLEMGESRATQQNRITCEEEERIARGYDIQTFITVDAGHMDRIQRATLKCDGEPLLNLRYIPAARLVDINFGWRSQREQGFPILTATGIWKASPPQPRGDGAETPACALVKLHTSDTADALYIEPMKALGLDRNGVVTLQYALLRGIADSFQVEPSELGSETLGSAEAPNMLLYEAAEGSLGILAQFVSVPDVMRRVVDAAIKLLRYDDPAYKAPASYDDLLSYYNQRDHKILDRHLIRDALERLRACQLEIHGDGPVEAYEDQYARLCATLDPASTLERTFIDHLHARSLRLPDRAQQDVPELYCRPDFFYAPDTWVFIDGSPHDRPEVREKDMEVRQRMRALGHDVLVYHYRDDLDAFVASRPDIFRKVRS